MVVEKSADVGNCVTCRHRPLLVDMPPCKDCLSVKGFPHYKKAELKK